MDFSEDFGNDREPSTEPIQDFDENLADDIEDWDGEGSRTPVYDNDKVKPRKRLVKKASSVKETIDVPELIDEDVEDAEFDEFMGGRGGGTDYDDKVGRKRKKEKDRSSSGSGKEKKHKFPGRVERKSEEINEMWDSIARNPEVIHIGYSSEIVFFWLFMFHILKVCCFCYRMMKKVLGLWMMIISLMILVWILPRGMEVTLETALQPIILRYE